MNINNATALVTGANRGIGLEIVKSLLNAGVRRIYAGARNRMALSALRDLDVARVVPIHLDVTDLEVVNGLREQASDVNLLVNNAGVLSFGDFLTTSTSDVRRQFETNFFGTLNMTSAFAPVIKRNGEGMIVNVLTLVALASMPSLSGYNASKAAAWSLTQSLRGTLASKNIKVMGVFPGAVDTDMLAGVDIAKTSPGVIAQAIVDGIEADQEDIFPDPMSSQTYAVWKRDHKMLEHQFSKM